MSDFERGTDGQMVAAVTTSQSMPDQAACWSSRGSTTSETGASYCGTVVTALVSGDSGSTYVVSDFERGTDGQMVAAVTTSQSMPDQAACWSSRGSTTSETGASYCGTVVTALVSGDSGSKACLGRGDWEF